MKKEIFVTYNNIIRDLLNEDWVIDPDGWSRSNIESIIFLNKGKTKIALSLKKNDDFLSDEYGEFNIYEYTYTNETGFKTLNDRSKVFIND